jgi:hypothetical protein
VASLIVLPIAEVEKFDLIPHVVYKNELQADPLLEPPNSSPSRCLIAQINATSNF